VSGSDTRDRFGAWARTVGRIPREALYLVAIATVALIVSGGVPEYRAYDWTLWAIFGLLAASFAFVWGHAGIFSFGQAGFFGIGAYAYGAAGINLSPSTGETLTALLVGTLVAGVAAALLGYFIFYGNVGDVYVAIITLAVTLVLLTVMSSTANPKYHVGDALLGGYNGMAGIPPVMLGARIALDTRQMFVFSVILAAAVALLLNILRRRPFGRILAGLRENETRTQLLGYDVRRYKLGAFTAAGLVAGLAGALYAAWGMFVNPSVFTLQQAALVAIWVLVGGRNSLLGAFVGVALVQGLSTALGGSGGTWTPIVLGGVLILVVLLLPDGVVPSALRAASRIAPWMAAHPLLRSVRDRLRADESVGLQDVLAARSGESTPKRLGGNGLVKHFGGVKALNGVDLQVDAGSVRALIGPNGAGKSTCFNLLVGRYTPTEGAVWLGDHDVTRLRPDQRAAMGIGIKMQVPSYYGDLTVFENLWMASFAALGSVEESNRQAMRVLRWLGMETRAALDASALSHGEHQWLEIGMVVAGAPSVMLLDEPTAGMTREETHKTVEMIREMSEYATVVVVEHDMEFVRELNAPVTMFHQGLVFAEGSIEELRSDERVLDTYLGRRPSIDAAG
jgi:branched-chain amino acid transport system permease protein